MEETNEEESASGIAVDDVSDLEALIDGIIDQEKLAEESGNNEGPLTKPEAENRTKE